MKYALLNGLWMFIFIVVSNTPTYTGDIAAVNESIKMILQFIILCLPASWTQFALLYLIITVIPPCFKQIEYLIGWIYNIALNNQCKKASYTFNQKASSVQLKLVNAFKYSQAYLFYALVLLSEYQMKGVENAWFVAFKLISSLLA